MKDKPKRARLSDLLGRGVPQSDPVPMLTPHASRDVGAPDTVNPPAALQKQLNVLISLDVHRRAKAKASLEGTTLGAVAERLFRTWLGDPET
jgi:hypothetical protein